MSIVVCKILENGYEIASDSIMVRGWTQSKGTNTKSSKLFEVNGLVIGSVGTAEETGLWKVRRHLKEKCGFTDEQIDRKIVIAQLRSHLEFFGADTSDMTDEEIEQGIVELSKIVANSGISANEAAEAFSESGRRLNNAEVGV